jgi:hypothetical protein
VLVRAREATRIGDERVDFLQEESALKGRFASQPPMAHMVAYTQNSLYCSSAGRKCPWFIPVRPYGSISLVVDRIRRIGGLVDLADVLMLRWRGGWVIRSGISQVHSMREGNKDSVAGPEVGCVYGYKFRRHVDGRLR